MSNQEHFSKLLDGASTWRQWRAAHPDVVPDLSDVILSGMDLRDYNFSGCNLARAAFERADLTGADFSKADASGANFSGANLRDANFAGARIEDAIFQSGANAPDGIPTRRAVVSHLDSSKANRAASPEPERYGTLKWLTSAFVVIAWLIGISSFLAVLVLFNATTSGPRDPETVNIALVSCTYVLASGILSALFFIFLSEVGKILLDIAENTRH